MMMLDCPEIAQEARHLARGGGCRRDIVGCGIYNNDGFGNEIQSALDLTMPETPSDPLDSLGEASASLAISLRGVGPARGRLCDVLNSHRKMEPCVDGPLGSRASKRILTRGSIAIMCPACRRGA
jgi:hypothetical protein